MAPDPAQSDVMPPLGRFSGSYDPNDVVFLLKPVALDFVEVEDKELRIQSGRAHYSEMLSRETVPDSEYLAAYDTALAVHGARMAGDLATLAVTLCREFQTKPPVLISLVRAGVPPAILLRRALQALGVTAPHYAISIIRDRGIDAVALDWIRARHDDDQLIFIDGWTGKGAIRGELERALPDYNAGRGAAVPARLAVLTDLAGVADLAATAEDYLIPSAILNSIVSGLVSRSVLNDQVVGPGDPHACVLYDGLAHADRSRSFLDYLTPLMMAALPDARPFAWTDAHRARQHRIGVDFVDAMMDRYGVTDRNRIKPGIGEATRALLRRVPDRLILSAAHADAEDLRHLHHLAATRSVPVDILDAIPYRAAAVIASLGDA